MPSFTVQFQRVEGCEGLKWSMSTVLLNRALLAGDPQRGSKIAVKVTSVTVRPRFCIKIAFQKWY